MSLTLLYAAVFIAALVAAEAVLRGYFRTAENKRAVNYRMRLLEDNEDHREVYREMLKERGGEGSWLNFNLLGNAREFYTQSGIRFDPVRFALYGTVTAVVTWLGLRFLVPGFVVRLVLFVLIAAIVPVVVVWRVRARRMRNFLQKLPEALDVATRSLAAGHPLPSAISLVAREMPDPVGSEFGLLSDELTYGVALEDALVNMKNRVGVEDLDLLAISLSVQAGTGGNLVEILTNLSTTLRDRMMLKAKIKSISAEGRITAIFMSMYPFLLYALIKTLAPTYFDPVWNSGYGSTVVTILLVVMAIGNVILYKMVNFEF